VIVELSLSAMLLLGPPVGEGLEGPAAPAEVDEVDEGEAEAGEAEAGEPLTTEAEAATLDDESAAIVEAAARAVQDRAVLERNNREVPEFVRHLDALATIEDRLDTCGKAVQAELRMDLALAYLRAAGSCEESEAVDTDEAPPELAYPRECEATANPNDCAAQLLERAAEFGDSGPAGAEDPLAQADGCSHAAESMSVERMFGACVAQEYQAALERWRASQAPPPPVVDRSKPQLEVPRWASILGISLGVGAIAAGATLVAIDGRCPGGQDPMTDIDQCPNIYNTDAGGAVLISVGALAVVGMGTILTINELRAKKSKNKASVTAMRRRMQRVTALTGWQLPRLQARPQRRL
jgi:hypothetical protein